MKWICMWIFTWILVFPVIGQSLNAEYDSTLAKTLGADDYGMKRYVLVILKTGTNAIEDQAKRDSLFSEHLKNIRRLADMGKLVVAGPIGKNDNTYRGIFILDVSSLEEAKELLETDATIKEKLLDAELYQWYGSAALPVYLKTSDKIANIILINRLKMAAQGDKPLRRIRVI